MRGVDPIRTSRTWTVKSWTSPGPIRNAQTRAPLAFKTVSGCRGGDGPGAVRYLRGTEANQGI